MKLPSEVHWNAKEYNGFSSLIKDYLTQQASTFEFYSLFPGEKELQIQAEKKLKQYRHRAVTAEALEKQLSGLELSPAQSRNLKKLREPNSVTITTGHQLNLMTGPVYLLYKITQVVRCADYMNSRQSEFYYIPLFWMATEDHDFEEINHFYYREQKISWERDFGGPVGRMKLTGIRAVFEEFFKLLPDSESGDEIRKMVEKSYFDSSTLTEATRKLVQLLFGESGLLMIDGDDVELKKLMIPAFEEDLIKHTAFHEIESTNRRLEKKGYGIQVHPREINLFYLLGDDVRERIVKEKGVYRVLNTELRFTEEEILNELKSHPDRFSPNVILRPLFQETILPNLAYTGGFGESAYWLQLKSFFESQKIPFPIIIARNSMLLISRKQRSRLERLDVSYKSLFLPKHKWINSNVMAHSQTDINFNGYRENLEKMFDELDTKAVQTDVTFSRMVDAERCRQLKGLDRMIKRLEKAERRKQSDRYSRLEKIYGELFPLNNLQERVENFSVFRVECGSRLNPLIYETIHPIEFRFIVKTIS